MSPHDVALCMAADRQGLLPDPQYQTAMLAAVIANANRGKDQKPAELEDFLLKHRRKRQSRSEMMEGFHRRRRDGGNR